MQLDHHTALHSSVELDEAVHESSQRVVVTTRLLLRCMWQCLLQPKRNFNGAQEPHHAARMSSEKAPQNRHATNARSGVITTNSRAVYRDVVLRQRQGLLPSADAKPRHGAPPLPLIPVENDVFSTSVSFALLRSTLTMSLALLFLRRLRRTACHARPLQMTLATSLHKRRTEKIVFVRWRDVTRAAWRWRRWALRRCVDHWWQYVQRKLAVRAIISTFLIGVRRRANGHHAIQRTKARRCFRHWVHLWTQRSIERQLATRCAQFCAVKSQTRSEYEVRTQLNLCNADNNDRHTGVELNASRVSMMTSASHQSAVAASSLAYCFHRWVRRTEERLNEFCAATLWRRRLMHGCFVHWKSRWTMERTGDEHGTGHAPHHIMEQVVTHNSASPTQTAYRLAGFLATKRKVQRARVLHRWAARWRARVADRMYVHSLCTRVLVQWMHRTADRQAALHVKANVFQVWSLRYNLRLQRDVADELHRQSRLQSTWCQWQSQLRKRACERHFCSALKRRCLRQWREDAIVRRFHARRLQSIVHNGFVKWKLCAQIRQQREMQELVAEALWQHITVTWSMRRWKARLEGEVSRRIQEQTVDDAIDSRLRERVIQKCFAKWRKRLLN